MRISHVTVHFVTKKKIIKNVFKLRIVNFKLITSLDMSIFRHKFYSKCRETDKHPKKNIYDSLIFLCIKIFAKRFMNKFIKFFLFIPSRSTNFNTDSIHNTHRDESVIEDWFVVRVHWINDIKKEEKELEIKHHNWTRQTFSFFIVY